MDNCEEKIDEVFEKTITIHVYTEAEAEKHMSMWPDKGFHYCFNCGLALEYSPRKDYLDDENNPRYYTSIEKDGKRRTVILCIDCLIEKSLFEVV